MSYRSENRGQLEMNESKPGFGMSVFICITVALIIGALIDALVH